MTRVGGHAACSSTARAKRGGAGQLGPPGTGRLTAALLGDRDHESGPVARLPAEVETEPGRSAGLDRRLSLSKKDGSEE
jgi:hypothetical protein